jgi:hypothetical protein
MGVEFLLKDIRMDGWAFVMKLQVAFRNFANAPHQEVNTMG